MEEILFHNKPEFQVVIIIEYDDGRMFPLTEGCPKSLLPIANRKLLAYQLDILGKSGVLEVLVVSPKEYHTQLSRFIADYRLESDNGGSQRYIPCVELVIVDEMLGSADGLRAVSERIRGPEFICISFDFFSEVALGMIHVQCI
jgi:NDP-sugar pyrophosphorylase family protein